MSSLICAATSAAEAYWSRNVRTSDATATVAFVSPVAGHAHIPNAIAATRTYVFMVSAIPFLTV